MSCFIISVINQQKASLHTPLHYILSSTSGAAEMRCIVYLLCFLPCFCREDELEKGRLL